MSGFALRTSAAGGMLLCLALVCGWGSLADAEDDPPEVKPAVERFTVEAARSRAQLMHRVYAATLDAMHHHYFHANKSVLPARAMEDIFREMAREEQVSARWIAVNTKAMSLDHEPATEFEKEAAKQLSAGEPEHTVIEDGHFRRAAPIPLSAGCVHCHTGSFANHKTPRYAGLVISIPVQGE